MLPAHIGDSSSQGFLPGARSDRHPWAVHDPSHSRSECEGARLVGRKADNKKAGVRGSLSTRRQWVCQGGVAGVAIQALRHISRASGFTICATQECRCGSPIRGGMDNQSSLRCAEYPNGEGRPYLPRLPHLLRYTRSRSLAVPKNWRAHEAFASRSASADHGCLSDRVEGRWGSAVQASGPRISRQSLPKRGPVGGRQRWL